MQELEYDQLVAASRAIVRAARAACAGDLKSTDRASVVARATARNAIATLYDEQASDAAKTRIARIAGNNGSRIVFLYRLAGLTE